MYFSVVGINHRTAPVSLREKATVRAGQLPDVLAMLNSHIDYGIVLSTCNRTEIYSVASSKQANRGTSLNFLEGYFGVAREDLEEHTYHYTGRTAVEHLFRVISGLDSQVIGEYEIMGQVRQALDGAEQVGMVSLPLRRVFQDAIRTGRRVREETGISKNALSISSVAVELSVRVVGDLRRCRMLVIGAGEAGKLVAQAARDRGTQQIKVASRTLERAAALADTLGGTAIKFEDIVTEIGSSDLVITCADAPHCILTPLQVEAAQRSRNGNPLVIIDIAVPRNVAPDVGQVERVFLYNIDDLNQISEQNRRAREREIEKAERVITVEVDRFMAWWRSHAVRPVISALMDRAHRIRTSYLNKTLKRLPPLTEEERYSLEKMTEAIVVKLLKDPISRLKEDAGDNGEAARIVNHLFRLDAEGQE